MNWQSVAQPVVAQLLRRAVAANQLSHAYIFSGPPGAGQYEAAVALAAALQCRCPTDPGSACTTCPDCQLIRAGTHPDVLIISPEGASLKRDQIVAMQRWISLRPADGHKRVCILSRAEAMTTEAANAALKILEEPPAYAVFLLLTSNSAALLPTIRSRCQHIVFPPLADEDVASILEQDGIAAADARLLAALAAGSPERAREMVNSLELATRKAQAQSLLTALDQLDDVECLSRAESQEAGREEAARLLDIILLYLRDASLKACGSQLPAVTPDSSVLAALATQGLDTLLQMSDVVLTARAALDRNANVRLVMDVLMLRLAATAQQSGA